MNRIDKKPLSKLGFDFVTPAFLEEGQSEFDHRNSNIDLGAYRPLAPREISILEANLNEAENWKDVWVKEGFNPYLVKNCRFFGIKPYRYFRKLLLRIQKLAYAGGVFITAL